MPAKASRWHIGALSWYYKSTSTDAAGAPAAGNSLYLLYWYKSTSTDAAGAPASSAFCVSPRTFVPVKRVK
jgi:hypothetical protein